VRVEFQEPCHAAREARLLHTPRIDATNSAQNTAFLTVAENTFRDSKLTDVFLVGYKAFADLAGKGVMFVITIVAARRLTASAFGVFALSSTLGWMLAIAADCGIQLHVARAVARAPHDAGAVLAPWLRVRAWTTAASIAIVMLGLIALRADVAFAMPILLFALVYGGNGLIEFLHYYYRGLSRTDIESSLTLWQRGATLLCGVAALLWRPNVSVLALAMLVPIAATLAISVRIANDQSTSGPSTVDRSPSTDSLQSEFWRDVFPIGLAAVLSTLYFRIDVFLVEWWSGTEAVALYNAVFRLVEALRLFPAAVLAVMLPTIVRAADRRPLVRVSTAVLAFAIVTSVLLWLAADQIVPLVYGSSFAGAVTTFRILVLSFPLLSLNYALTHQLVGWNAQRAYAAICGLALAVNVALNARLIPALGIDGAAWSTLGTEAFLTIACLYALGAIRTSEPRTLNPGTRYPGPGTPNPEAAA